MSHYDDLDSILEEAVLYAISAALTHRGFEVQEGDPPTLWRNGVAELRRSGNTYTMERTINSGDGGDGALDDLVEGWMKEFQTEIFDHYPAVIPPLFDDWRGVELLSDLVPEREALQDGLTWINITPGSAQAGGGGGFAGGEISRPLGKLDWRASELRGRAAEAFYGGYVSRVDESIGNNAVLMSGLEIAMVAQYEVIEGVRNDIGKIAVAAREAMKASGKLSSSFDDTTVAIAVLGALASAVAIVGTGGLAAAASAGAASAGLLNAIRGATREDKNVTVSGDHPDDVVADLETTLSDEKNDVRREEEKIADKLDALAATAAGRGDPGEAQPDFDLGSPKLLGKRDASDILDEREDPSDIRFTYDSVDAIANRLVPAIGDCLDQARKGLGVTSGPFNRPYTVGLGSTGIYSSYAALQEEVIGNLTSLKQNLQRAGETLEIAVQHLGKADEGVDRQLDQRADRLDKIEARILREEREQEQVEDRPPHIMPPGGLSPY